MKISKHLFFLLPMFIAGCHGTITQTGRQDQSDTITPVRKKEVKKHFSNFSCDSTIINNEFSLDALAFKVFKADTNKIKSLFLNPVVLKFESQKNAEGGSYNLYNFTDGVNKLTLYNNSGFYLEDSDIKNDKVRLNKKISIGMAKGNFLKLVKRTDIKCDTITVVNDESTFETVYIFDNLKLREIKMGQIVE
ncbi:hypothetical protein BDD43_3965 [Mucilaginibacter gracilis]|uniref:Lipoprotein n=1 Tax=Mucilaginibacter gracilis TaxID=423350 RepID=A0A495J4W7_9SPHI|nr:hypothetical protein [Mucilaginibacter gracilis]RKR83751.1 hypothetical protein BDD43_3965 [Mucilaginibacter gracilis]